MRLAIILALCGLAAAGDGGVDAGVKLDGEQLTDMKHSDLKQVKPKKGKSAEDQIPVIEIKGEGKPMTAAQIRALEEETSGPADIKVKHTWRPLECPKKAARKDFITFHYKGFLEDGKKFMQTYGKYGELRIQLGVGMIIPGLDKGMKGMCDTELRKIQVPYRLSRKRKSTVWKHIPNEEHWLTFDIEMLTVEEWTPELQFQYFDLNNDTTLTVTELTKWSEKMRREFGKHWHNEDIDNKLAAEYFVKYFDEDGDGKITLDEYKKQMQADEDYMQAHKTDKKPKGRKRDPGVAWILDFNNDGVVDAEEMDEAPERLEGTPKHVENRQAAKTEL